MKITIIAVGKLKEKYLKKGVNEYSKKINFYHQFEIIELSDEKTKENMSDVELNQVKNIEGQKILNKISENSYVIALAIEGKEITTDEFKNQFRKASNLGKNVVFIIGGSLGLSDEVLKKANFKVSFSKMTFPHQLMRVILLDQIAEVITGMK